MADTVHLNKNMILQILFFLIFGILGAFGSIMPGYGEIPLPLPWGIDSLFVTASNYFHGAMETLPYLQVVWTCFLLALGFELAMLIMKLFLGSRTPHATN